MITIIYKFFAWICKKLFPYTKFKTVLDSMEINGKIVILDNDNEPVRVHMVQFNHPVSPSIFLNAIRDKIDSGMVWSSQKILLFKDE